MSYYDDQTHRQNLDSVCQLKIGQACHLLIHPRCVENMYKSEIEIQYL